MTTKKKSSAEQNLAEAFEAEKARESDHNKNPEPYPLDRQRDSSLPYLNVVKDGQGYNIEMNHHPEYGYPELEEALGTTDPRIVRGLLTQILNATMYGKFSDEDALNFMVAFIKDNKPRNSIDALLLAHAGRTHELMMNCSRFIAEAKDPLERGYHVNTHSKLSRTFASQIETFRRHQAGGEQRIVEHRVSVNGNITHQFQQNSIDKVGTSPAVTDARAEPMPMMDQPKRLERVPRANRRTKTK